MDTLLIMVSIISIAIPCLRPILKYHAIQSHIEESGMFSGGRKIVRYEPGRKFGELQRHVVRHPYVSKRCFFICWDLDMIYDSSCILSVGDASTAPLH